MSISCGDVRERVAEYLEERLTCEEGRSLKAHLASCAVCRDEAGLMEPALLFARTEPEEVSLEDAARILSGVRAGVAIREAERKLSGARARRRRRIAAVASAAALAAMTLVLPGSGPRRERTASTVSPTGEAPAEGFAPAARSGQDRTFPADATIYDWNPGAGIEEPRVVWIVDRSLDI